MRRRGLLCTFAALFICSDGLTRDVIEKAAKKCCTPNRVDCCIEFMIFGSPISCGYESDAHSAVIIYECLQNQLFAGHDSSSKMNLNDSLCCRVFADDSNDERRRCESVCKTAVQLPSVDVGRKLTRIRQCTVLDNPLYECFVKCRQLSSSEQKDIRVLQFNEYCNSTFNEKRGFQP